MRGCQEKSVTSEKKEGLTFIATRCSIVLCKKTEGCYSANFSNLKPSKWSKPHLRFLTITVNQSNFLDSMTTASKFWFFQRMKQNEQTFNFKRLANKFLQNINSFQPQGLTQLLPMFSVYSNFFPHGKQYLTISPKIPIITKIKGTSTVKWQNSYPVIPQNYLPYPYADIGNEVSFWYWTLMNIMNKSGI